MNHSGLLPVLVASSGCGPEVLATVENGTRIAELANGDMLVGTADGRIVGVNGFGETWTVEDELGSSVRDVTSNAVGVYWVLLSDGRLLRATPWSLAREQQRDVIGALYSCQGLQLGTTDAPGPWAGGGSVALGPACELVVGAADGRLGDEVFTNAALTRVQAVDDGYLWVDAAGRAGCRRCDAAVGGDGVVDAWVAHGVPFVEGEVVWLDRNGTLWIR